MVLPTAVAIATGPRAPASLATFETETSAATQLRLDQISEVIELARSAAAGEIAPARGLQRLDGIRAMPSRYNALLTIVGYVVTTVGIGLILRPVPELLGAYVLFGLLVAILRDGATRIAGLGAILPVLAAGIVSALAFSVSRHYEAAPLEALIPPLVQFLPGALLTMATVDLAADELVTGASRFLAGLLQLALLALGIVAGAMLVGVTTAGASHAPRALLGGWAPWLGVAVFAAGTTLQHSAPARSLPWLLVVLYSAWCGQLLGQALFDAQLSGFVGGLVTAPTAMLIERLPSAPPALVSFLPAFWLLVPGALGLIGFTQLVGNDPSAGMTSLFDALTSIVSIALGILVGIRAVRIGGAAIASASRFAHP